MPRLGDRKPWNELSRSTQAQYREKAASAERQQEIQQARRKARLLDNLPPLMGDAKCELFKLARGEI